MEFAVTILLISILLLPGIVFRKFYYTEEFSKQYIKKNFFELFISTLFPSLIFHSIWFFLVPGITNYFINIKLLGYFFSENKLIFFDNLQKYFLQILLYNITIIIFAGIVGYLGKIIIRYNKLDRKYKFFRFINSWHYIFNGEFFDFPRTAYKIQSDVDEIEMVYIDVLTNTHDNAILYSGFLIDYELDGNSGKLKYIVLRDAKKQFFVNKCVSKKRKYLKRKKEIIGNVFIIPFIEVKNINLMFLKFAIDYNENGVYLSMTLIE